MYFIILSLIFMMTSASAQILPIEYIQSLEGLTQINEEVESKEPVKNDSCGSEEEHKRSKLAEYISFEVEPMFGFSMNHISGNFKKSEKIFLDVYPDNYYSNWISLVTPKSQADRERVMAEICQEMSQEEAIRFAGYLGKKTSVIYDYDRVSGSGLPQENERISMDDYAQAMRNYFNIDTAGGNLHEREKMGVCGDAAMFIANFLSHCGFSCEDLDLSSYRTEGSGHVMVSARGKDGDFYTANWSESSKYSNTNPLTMNVADPNNIRTGSVMNLYDCNGMAKGKTLTPLGNLLMLAHGKDDVFNTGQNFSEVKLIAKELGFDEFVLSVFSGEDSESGQKLEGIAAKVTHQLGTESELLQMDFRTSLVFGKAVRPLHRYESSDSLSLEQDVLSSWGVATLQINALRKGPIKISPFISVEGHYMTYKLNYKSEGGDQVKDENQDGYLDLAGGLKIRTKSDGKLVLDSEVGLSSTHMRKPVQRGGVEIGTAPEIPYKWRFIPDHLYADANVYVNHNNGSVTGMRVQYDNLFLMKRSQIRADAYKQLTNTTVTSGYRFHKIPTNKAVHGVSLGVQQGIPLKNSELIIKGSADYYFVEEMLPWVNVGVIYRIGK